MEMPDHFFVGKHLSARDSTSINFGPLSSQVNKMIGDCIKAYSKSVNLFLTGLQVLKEHATTEKLKKRDSLAIPLANLKCAFKSTVCSCKLSFQTITAVNLGILSLRDTHKETLP